MSLKLAEQLALVQEYIKIDKSDFNRAMEDAAEVLQSSRKYLSTLKRIKKISKHIKGIKDDGEIEAVMEIAKAYPQLKSFRELEVLSKALLGKTNKEIAKDLFVTEKTIKFHKTNIFKRCGFKNTVTMLADIANRSMIVRHNAGVLPNGN